MGLAFVMAVERCVFSSRRRDARCALGTGVQTGALQISAPCRRRGGRSTPPGAPPPPSSTARGRGRAEPALNRWEQPCLRSLFVMPTSHSTTDARGALASFLELIRPAGQRRTTGGDRDRLELGLVAVALRQKAFAGGGIAHRDRLARDREIGRAHV